MISFSQQACVSRKIILVLSFLFLGSLTQTAFSQIGFRQEGIATYYAHYFHGKRTASGETFNMNAKTAAHRTLKFGTVVKVTNLKTMTSSIVKINDRGPYGAANRIIDLSSAVAKDLGLLKEGIANVSIEVVDTNANMEHGAYMATRPYVPPRDILTSTNPGRIIISQMEELAKEGVYTVDGVKIKPKCWSLYMATHETYFCAVEYALYLKSLGIEDVMILSEKDDQKILIYKVLVGNYTTFKEAEANIHSFHEKGIPPTVYSVQSGV